MTRFEISTCRSCFRVMAWAMTGAGRMIPLDADRNAGRPLEYTDDGKAGRIQEMSLLFPEATVAVRTLGDGELADPDLPIWRSHFATCPNADEHRRTR